MRKVKVISVIILFVIVGWTACKQSDSIQSDELIVVDVTANYPKKELLLQDFMDVQYIPLETTDEFITAANIRSIGKELIIVDNINRPANYDGNIYVFDKSGKGVRKINRSGQGGEEYLNIGGVTLDEERDELFVNSHYIGKVVTYDLLGNFKRSFSHKEETFYFPLRIFDHDHLITMDGNIEYEEQIRNRFFIISKEDGSITKEILIPYNEKKLLSISATDTPASVPIRNQCLIPYNTNWILMEPSSDTVYITQPDYTLTPFIVRTPSIQSMNTEVFLFPCVLTDRYYFMQTVKKEFDFVTGTGFPKTDLLYDRQKNTLFEYVLYNDDFVDKKPINLENRNVSVINSDEITFAQRLEAFDLVEAYEEGKLKGKLREIAAELDEESNPVIMVATYKK